MSQFFLGLQRVLPQHGLSRLVGWLASSQTPFIRRFFIHSFARAYNISLADAERKHLDDYQSFNDFFTRSLAADARPMPEQPNRLACPVDGTVSQTGRIERDLLMQAASAMRLSARSYTRMLRVARTIADLAGAEQVGRIHVAEALSYRRQAPRA